MKTCLLSVLVSTIMLLGACSSNSNDSADPQQDPAQTIATPTNLRGVVYTFSEIELLWSNPSNSSAVRWEIARDGIVVGTAPGPSFYESGLQELTEYSYTVTPLDSENMRGTAAQITLRTKADEPVITDVTAEALSREVIQQLALSPLVPYLEQLRVAYYTAFLDAPFSGDVNCPDGGTASADRTQGVTVSFSDCIIGTDRWNGNVTFKQQPAGCSTDFSDTRFIDNGGLPIEVNGSLIGTGDLYHHKVFQGRVVQRMEQGSIILDGTINVTHENSRTLTASYTYQSQQTGNRPLQVATLGGLKLSNDGIAIDEGVIEIKDPAGGRVTNTFEQQDNGQQWTVATQSLSTKIDNDIPEIDQWPIGADCQLLYPSAGLPITENGVQANNASDPFALSNLPQTLDTIFSIQRSQWIVDGFTQLRDLPDEAESLGGLVTAVPSEQAQLLDETKGFATQINPDTGLEETIEYLVFGVNEKIINCPLGGQVTDSKKYAGSQVFSRILAEQCIIDGTSYSGDYNHDWAKYSSYATIGRFEKRDEQHYLQIENASRSIGSALFFENTRAKRLVYEQTGQPTITVQNLSAEYNEEFDRLAEDYSRPVSRVSADVQIGDGVQMYSITTKGALHFLENKDVSTQGKLVATSADGSTLTISTGNGDNESFDVDVNSNTGYSYVYRKPYTDNHNIRVTSRY